MASEDLLATFSSRVIFIRSVRFRCFRYSPFASSNLVTEKSWKSGSVSVVDKRRETEGRKDDYETMHAALIELPDNIFLFYFHLIVHFYVYESVLPRDALERLVILWYLLIFSWKLSWEIDGHVKFSYTVQTRERMGWGIIFRIDGGTKRVIRDN